MNNQLFIMHIYCGKFVKRVILPDELEQALFIHIHSEDARDEHTVALRMEAVNGIWRIDPQFFSVFFNGQKSDGVIQSGRFSLLHKTLNIPLEIHVFQADQIMFPEKYMLKEAVELRLGIGEQLIIGYASDEQSSAAAICVEDGLYVLRLTDGVEAYINGIRTETATLNHGDIIILRDVMIIFLGEVIAVSAPTVSIAQILLDPYQTSEASSFEQGYADDSEEYFQPSPRVFYKLVEDTVSIDAPPPKKELKSTPAIFSIGASGAMFFVMLFSIWMRSQYSSNSMMLAVSLVMILGSAIGTIVFPMLLRRHQAKKDKQFEQMRIQKYQEYIDNLNQYLLQAHSENRKWLTERYHSVDKAFQIATFDGFSLQNNTLLWNKSPEYKDFLDIRIGVGARKSTFEIQMPRDSFSLVDDPLKKLAQFLYNKFYYIIDVPVSVSLFENYIVGVIGTRSVNIHCIQAMILQICTSFSYRDVKMCFVYDPDEGDYWDFVRWLPHAWTYDKGKRLVSTSKEGVSDLFNMLEKVLEDRKENFSTLVSKPKKSSGNNGEEVIVPHYVVFVMSRALMASSLIGLSMLEQDSGYGISFVYMDETINFLPKRTDIVIQNTSKESSVYANSDTSNKMRMFIADTARGLDLYKMARKLFQTRVINLTETASLPERLTFLGMYKAAKIEDLNVPKRWSSNRSASRIEAPVGVEADGKIFSINIHEKHHGPHGLMAGMTGSGKSEFIQSFILSLSINYNPHEIAFILIDYKGGGMAGQFIDLPHLAGIVTNLEGNEVERSLNTLSSELTRRQKEFKKLGVNSIDKYHQKFESGEVRDPMPHLLIISDEFAELKKNQPAFMQALVSAARIGRSLGVHLILATQNPSGVVDDDIRSNSNFRVCLRVLDRTHSIDMLKRPDAADITVPGRAYVQVGNNEIFTLVQSGYSGAPYIPSDKLTDESQKTVYLLDEGGRPVQAVSLADTIDVNTPTQLAAIVKYLKTLARAERYHTSMLWKPVLGNVIYWHDIVTELRQGTSSKAGKLAPVVGLVDDTAHQVQPLMEVPVSAKGHVAVYGLPGSGKTVFIQTLVSALARMYTPNDVNIYILDFATRSLRYFKELPHVGDVIFEEDEAKVNKFFSILEQMLQDRKRLFSKHSVSNFAGYNQENGEPLPAVVVIIHDFVALRDAYPDVFESLCKISANGVLYGIYMVITAKSYGTVPVKITGNITTTYAFQLKDKFDYANAFAQATVLIPTPTPGRGVLKRGTAMEFQIALAEKAVNDVERIGMLTMEFRQIAQNWAGSPALPVPAIPDPYICRNEIASYAYKQAKLKGRFPLGYDFNEVSLIEFPFEQMDVFPVCGFSKTGKTNYLRYMMELATSYGWSVMLFDNLSFANKQDGAPDNVHYAQSTEEYGSLVSQLNSIVGKRIRERIAFLQENGIGRLNEFLNDQEGILVAIDDFQDFIDIIDNDDLDIFHEMLDKFKKVKITLVATLNPELLPANVKTASPTYASIFKNSDGLLLGGGYEKLGSIFMNFRFDRKMQTATYPPGKGLLFSEQAVKVIVTPSIW